MNNLNLTILMPCLNEEGNIAFSIGQAQSQGSDTGYV